jgi:MazG family protein
MLKEYEYLTETKDNEGEAFERLRTIVGILRQKCPWDKVQTHESLRTCMLEEAYETIEAIDNKDVPNLREELGDVMLQVIFHGMLAEEDDAFSLTDVINEECEKMIRRHPHVFLEESAKSIDKALEKWENMKSDEHVNQTCTDRLEDVPKALPALMRSCKVQSRASKFGFDWDNIEDVFSKVQEEYGELRTSYDQSDEQGIEEELGDLLFSVVNLSRFLKVDPEESLTKSTNKFIQRFDKMEKMSAEKEISLIDMSLEQMNELWEEAKKSK